MIQPISRDEFLKALQSRAARVAVTASAVRGSGNKGIVRAARRYLGQMNLGPFGSSDAMAFAAALDSETDGLCAVLPVGARHWGVARKLLNIFLRDCFYTSYLATDFCLHSSERLLELPLDSITVKHLKRAVEGLPRWKGVRHLSPPLSQQLQEAAGKEAERKGIARVHLDALWWSVSRDVDGM
jgi:hypothetical protein